MMPTHVAYLTTRKFQLSANLTKRRLLNIVTLRIPLKKYCRSIAVLLGRLNDHCWLFVKLLLSTSDRQQLLPNISLKICWSIWAFMSATSGRWPLSKLCSMEFVGKPVGMLQRIKSCSVKPVSMSVESGVAYVLNCSTDLSMHRDGKYNWSWGNLAR